MDSLGNSKLSDSELKTTIECTPKIPELNPTTKDGVSAKQDLICGYCHHICDTSDALEQHVADHVKDKPFSCERCNIRFKLHQSLQFHTESVHKESKKIHKCPTCKKGFTTVKLMILHQKRHENPKYTCDQCDKSFVSNLSLKMHVKGVHGVRKPLSCHGCGEIFQTQSEITQHIAEKHVDLVRNQCEECGEVFAPKSALKSHLKTHASERPFPCPECHECFPSKSKLEVHGKSHLKFHCSQCDRSFNSKILLDSHLISHSLERPFVCTYCPDAFKRKGTLRIHLRSHTGEKPYTCQTCSRSFTTSSSLHTHERVHTRETRQYDLPLPLYVIRNGLQYTLTSIPEKANAGI